MERVLMFSTGLDSFILKTLYNFENEECLFIRLGTEENKEEEELINDYYPGVLKADLPIDRFELNNKIIPFRNQLLTFIGAQFATNIFFGFTTGDTTRDKDYVFKAQMEGSLNYFVGVPGKSPFIGETRYEINMPFKDFTKSQLVEKYLAAGNPFSELLQYSRSCYDSDNPCGICRSCLRKFVALELNGISSRSHFTENPADYLEDFLIESIDKKRSEKEIKEIQECLRIEKS